MLRAAAVVLLTGLALSGCTADEPGTSAGWEAPPADAQADYQLGGAYEPAEGVGVVVRDREEEPADGVFNVCYVNAFQTQPGEEDTWPEDLLLRGEDGKPVEDPEWPGEYVLDTSTADKREAIAEIQHPWIDDCAARGYRAVEPDNLDTYTRFPGLTRDGNLELAKLLADRAHDQGMSIAQKNTAELGAAGKEVAGFDFAVVESCQEFDECEAYTDVYGARMIEIEYVPQGRGVFEAACDARGENVSVVYRDRDVVPRGSPGYTYDFC